MPNPVLTRLAAERATQVDFIEQTLARVDAEQRDLVDAETRNMEAARERIAQLDAQITPLEQFEEIRSAHQQTARVVSTPSVDETRGRGGAGGPVPLGVEVRDREVKYETAGAFLVDYMRAIEFPGRAYTGPGDPDAIARVRAATGSARAVRAAGDVAAGLHQTTDQTPGLLPRNIVGTILNDLDAARPFIASVGVKDLSQIPGKNFDRPVITQHTKAGKQTAEKAEGERGQVKIGSVPFSKETYLTWMNVSRQEIDWTSPTAWDILIKDMIDMYGLQVEEDTAELFAGKVTKTTAMATDDVAGLIGALYAARSKVVIDPVTGKGSNLRMPDTIWVSTDMDDELGAMIDVHFAGNTNAIGSASLTNYGGQLLRLPRVMVPNLPVGTMILGKANRFEFYEERVGLLQAIEPRVFGVEVAYGGYTAAGMLDATAFAKITKPAP